MEGTCSTTPYGGPKTARTTEATHFTSCTKVARGPEFFSLEEEPSGRRPAPLSEVTGWQERVQRHCVQHLPDTCPFVQVLDADAPLPIEQSAEISNLEDDIPLVFMFARFPSRLSQCPRSRVHRVLLVFPVSEPQTAEQLVEVLTPFHIFEQNVDIPVPVGVVGGRQQGFLSGQGSVGEEIVDIPASGRGGSGSLLGFFPEQVADIPVLGDWSSRFSQDRVQQLLVPSRSPTILLVEFLTVFSQRRLLDLITWMSSCLLRVGAVQ